MSDPIAELLAGADISIERARVAAGISARTWSRYRSGVAAPPQTVLALIQILAGRMPWPGWERFQVQSGALYAPGAGAGVTPDQVTALPFIVQELELRRRQQQQPAQYLLDFD